MSFALAKKMVKTEKLLDILNSGKSEQDKITSFENANKDGRQIAKDVLGILKSQDSFGIKAIADLISYGNELLSAKA